MRYALLATTLLAMPASAQTTIAPFANPAGCPGLIYYQDFTKANALSGWNYGGTSNGLDGGNSPTGPSPLVTNTNSGLALTISGDNNTTMINTQGQFYHLYGYYEMTASLDAGLLSGNMNSAFWLMAEDGGWPPEIDAQETQGNTGDTALHSSVQPTTGVSYQWNMTPGTHVWGVDWNAQTITFYIDSQEVAHSNTPKDFNQPMFLVLSGIGRNGGTGHMTVQNIRVFKDMASAESCVDKSPAPSKTDPQVSALTSQVQQVSTQANQLQATIPTLLPQAPDTTQAPGYDPQFVQAGQQMQQQLSTIQLQIDAVQSQIQNFQLPQRPQ